VPAERLAGLLPGQRVARKASRLVEGDAAVVALVEDAIEDDDVEMGVGVEGGAEAVQEETAPRWASPGASRLRRR
jgi:hypothetical protein